MVITRQHGRNTREPRRHVARLQERGRTNRSAATVSRNRDVVDEPREIHVPFHAGRTRDTFQFVQQRAGAADDESRVGVNVDDVGHRFEQDALASQRVQSFDVEQ